MASSARQLHQMRIQVLLLCCVGITLSVYAYYVEFRAELNENYVASCDFGDKISCSKVFKSSYGKGFGLLQHVFGKDSLFNQPNSVFGIIFYLLQIACCYSIVPVVASVQFWTAVMSNAGSVYLASILYFVLNDMCVVCVSIYVVNAILLLVVYQRRQVVQRLQALDNSKRYS